MFAVLKYKMWVKFTTQCELSMKNKTIKTRFWVIWNVLSEIYKYISLKEKSGADYYNVSNTFIKVPVLRYLDRPFTPH